MNMGMPTNLATDPVYIDPLEIIIVKTNWSNQIPNNSDPIIWIFRSIQDLQTDLNTYRTNIDGAQFFIQLQKEDND